MPPGKSKITRDSFESSVTIPFEQTYRDLTQVSKEERDEIKFCGCGWPQNLLVPKGNPNGYPCELFVMISDYEQDKVKKITFTLYVLNYFLNSNLIISMTKSVSYFSREVPPF